jgi:tetratricopeptide (TPR) repeat protein
MNPKVLRRFIILMVVATFVMFTGWAVIKEFAYAPPGDYETRKGDILLGDRKYDEAIDWFTKALDKSPNHRGALMGRAIGFMQTDRTVEAEAEFDHLIDYLTQNLEPDDPTGRAVLAGAYANRGILRDRTGRYEDALADYIMALKIDQGAVEGPGIVHKILYGNSRPSTVEKRARYLAEQLALPEEERVMRRPDVDEQQRMFKP